MVRRRQRRRRRSGAASPGSDEIAAPKRPLFSMPPVHYVAARRKSGRVVEGTSLEN